jgi:threonine dehydrogenase-like Zn-dependent dehydrogenase
LTAVTLNEFEVIGSVVYNHEDFKKAVECIDSGAYPLEKVITHILSIDRAEEALQLLDWRTEDVGKILHEANPFP